MTAKQAAARVPKLTQYCLNSLVQSPLDNRNLYKLSTDELVELNSTLLKDYQAVKEKLSQLERHRYPVEPPRVQDRVGSEMYERVEDVTRAWAPVPADEVAADMSSLLDLSVNSPEGAYDILWDEATGQAVYQSRTGLCVQDWQRLLAYKTVISSALLMYRLCCLFPCDVEALGSKAYKYVWSTYLKHKSTNNYVGFSEWKGSPMFLSSKALPTGTAFDEDWLALLNLLIDPKCPHPYDGTVAGSVA